MQELKEIFVPIDKLIESIDDRDRLREIRNCITHEFH